MPPARIPAPPPVPTQSSRVQHLRKLIGDALAGGVEAEDLVLRLTARDASALKRNPSVGLHEVAFADGRMRFLRVEVAVGAVDGPLLERRDHLAGAALGKASAGG